MTSDPDPSNPGIPTPVTCSIHLADTGVKGFFRSPAPKAEDVPGMSSCQRLTAAGFNGKLRPEAPQLSRNGFIAFWEDDTAISRFLNSPAADAWTGGWHARSHVIRAVGRWPGLPTDIPRDVDPHGDGKPVIGVSIGPVRPMRGLELNRLNARIEAQLLQSDGVRWASAFFAPKTFLCTMTLWDDAASLHAFARSGAHMEGMKASLDPGFDPSLPQGTRFFRPDLLFMSMRPYVVEGSLAGKNPLPEAVFEGTLV